MGGNREPIYSVSRFIMVRVRRRSAFLLFGVLCGLGCGSETSSDGGAGGSSGPGRGSTACVDGIYGADGEVAVTGDACFDRVLLEMDVGFSELETDAMLCASVATALDAEDTWSAASNPGARRFSACTAAQSALDAAGYFTDPPSASGCAAVLPVWSDLSGRCATLFERRPPDFTCGAEAADGDCLVAVTTILGDWAGSFDALGTACATWDPMGCP